MNEVNQPVSDEIDLRAILMKLWKSRKAILITTLVAVIVAFCISFWILPRKYQATTYVLINQPLISFSQSPSDSGTKISLTTPDIKSVADLSTNQRFLQNILEDPKVVASISSGKISTDKLKDMATAVAVGKDQVSLKITGSDPKQVAILANAWAETITMFVNDTYGLGAVVKDLTSQVLQSKNEYGQTQAELEQALSESRVSILSVHLDSMKSELASVLTSITTSGKVLYDLQFFEQELFGLPGESLLSLGEELVLTNLRQRSITNGITNDIIQIDSATFSKSTVSQALKATSQIHAGFQNQLTRLQSNQILLEKEIPQMEKDLEIAKALLVQFTQDRDQSYRIYSELLIQQQEVNTLIGITQDLATVSFPAKTPTIAVSPKTLINTALAGLLGFILAASWIFIRDWMNNGASHAA